MNKLVSQYEVKQSIMQNKSKYGFSIIVIPLMKIIIAKIPK